MRYVARARPGSLLLEDGRRDEVVPRAALLNIADAAPKGTTVRWYDAPHALDRAAYHVVRLAGVPAADQRAARSAQRPRDRSSGGGEMPIHGE